MNDKTIEELQRQHNRNVLRCLAFTALLSIGFWASLFFFLDFFTE